VFLNHEGDLFRTRLTHSIEVAQIGRTLARSLRLNEDLVEATALAHDLGHTPFGHVGQDVLNECMKDYGGFEHTLQSLRVGDELACFARHRREVKAECPELAGRRELYETIRRMITSMTADLVRTSARRLEEAAPASIDEVRAAPPLIRFSDTMRAETTELKR